MLLRVTKIWVINLERDKDRLKWMGRQFGAVAFERFSAYLPESIPTMMRERFVDGESGTPLLDGERACFASHLGVLERMAEEAREDEYWMVCEDDLEIESAFVERVQEIDWGKEAEIIRLNEFPKAPARWVKALAGGYELVEYSRTPNGAGAYLVSRAGAKKLLDQSWGVNVAFDVLLRWVWATGIRTRGVFPPPVKQDVFGVSSIDQGGQRRPVRRNYELRGKTAGSQWGKRLRYLAPLCFRFGPGLIFGWVRMKLGGVKRDREGRFILGLSKS
ncbi:MAG: glycosyltransferase family 25 protein [Verrucomicrobiota bacterium]